MLPQSDIEKTILPTPIVIRNDRIGLHTSPIERRSIETSTTVHSHQSDTNSPKNTRNFNQISSYHNHRNSNTNTTPQTTNSHMTSSYYSSSPSTYGNPFRQKFDSEQQTKLDSSTTICSSSHQSDSLYNPSIRTNSSRIITTSFNNRMKTAYSPTLTRKILMTPTYKTNDNEDNQPRQILLPIGGGLIGKLATSTTSLSYRSSNSVEQSPMHRQYRNPSTSGINDDTTSSIVRTRL